MTANASCASFSILAILRVSRCHCNCFVIVVVAATIPALVLDCVRIAGGASAADFVALRARVLLAGSSLVSVPALLGLAHSVFSFLRETGMCASSTLGGACSFLMDLVLRWLSMAIEFGSVWQLSTLGAADLSCSRTLFKV